MEVMRYISGGVSVDSDGWNRMREYGYESSFNVKLLYNFLTSPVQQTGAARPFIIISSSEDNPPSPLARIRFSMEEEGSHTIRTDVDLLSGLFCVLHG